MTAICTTCLATVYWRNQRGNQMPKACSCGGVLVRAEWTPEGYRVPEPKPPRPKRRRACCALCGKSGMAPGWLRVLKGPETFNVIRTKGWGIFSQLMGNDPIEKTLEPETIVCRSHESRESNVRNGREATAPYPVFDRRHHAPAPPDGQ